MTSNGANLSRRWLIVCNGQPHVTFTTRSQALGYVDMQRAKADLCPKGQDTFAVKATWEIRDTRTQQQEESQ